MPQSLITLISQLTATSAYVERGEPMNDSLTDLVWACELPVPNWKFVLVAMAHCAGERNFFDGSIDGLSEMTGLSDSCVSNAIMGLESRHFIAEVSESGQDGWRINLVNL